MDKWLAILGIVGGCLTFFTAVFAVTRNVLKQVGATEDNSAELRQVSTSVGSLTQEVVNLKVAVEQQTLRLAIQSERLSRLEASVRANGGGSAPK